jgi:hypothetical protein
LSWILTSGPDGIDAGAKPWAFDQPYAITCDEIFLRGGYLEMNIARVRLDALGPGIPPD